MPGELTFILTRTGGHSIPNPAHASFISLSAWPLSQPTENNTTQGIFSPPPPSPPPALYLVILPSLHITVWVVSVNLPLRLLLSTSSHFPALVSLSLRACIVYTCRLVQCAMSCQECQMNPKRHTLANQHLLVLPSHIVSSNLLAINPDDVWFCITHHTHTQLSDLLRVVFFLNSVVPPATCQVRQDVYKTLTWVIYIRVGSEVTATSTEGSHGCRWISRLIVTGPSTKCVFGAARILPLYDL